MSQQILEMVEKKSLKPEPSEFEIGDTVKFVYALRKRNKAQKYVQSIKKL